jgi:hypothetical protein
MVAQHSLDQLRALWWQLVQRLVGLSFRISLPVFFLSHRVSYLRLTERHSSSGSRRTAGAAGFLTFSSPANVRLRRSICSRRKSCPSSSRSGVVVTP